MHYFVEEPPYPPPPSLPLQSSSNFTLVICILSCYSYIVYTFPSSLCQRFLVFRSLFPQLPQTLHASFIFTQTLKSLVTGSKLAARYSRFQFACSNIYIYYVCALPRSQRSCSFGVTVPVLQVSVQVESTRSYSRVTSTQSKKGGKWRKLLGTEHGSLQSIKSWDCDVLFVVRNIFVERDKHRNFFTFFNESD
jgi:hypothetical protein